MNAADPTPIFTDLAAALSSCGSFSMPGLLHFAAVNFEPKRTTGFGYGRDLRTTETGA